MPNDEKILIKNFVIDSVQVRAKNENDSSEQPDIIDFTFASENLVNGVNTGYNEILHFDDGCIVPTYFNDGLPFREEHWRNTQFGIIENIKTITKNGVRMLQGSARFSRSQRGQEIFNDIKDKIKKLVSVGYNLIDGYLDENGTLHATKWEPFEVSITEEPIDRSVGFFRSIDKNYRSIINNLKGVKMPDPVITQTAPVVEPVPVGTVQNRSYDEERDRVLKIKEIGSVENVSPEIIINSIIDGTSIQEFRSIAKVSDNKSKVVQQVGLSDKEQKKYSLYRAVEASATGNWEKAGFEKALSDEVAKTIGRQARSFFVPPDILNMKQKRAIDGTVISTNQNAAGHIYPEYRYDSFIDLLRDNMLIPELGVQSLTGLTAELNIPEQTGGATGTWIDQGEDIPDTAFTSKLNKLSPKNIGAAITITKQMLQVGHPSLEAFSYRELAEAIAGPVDLAAFLGTGLKQPTGLFTLSGIDEFDGDNFDEQSALDVIGAVKNNNVHKANFTWVGNSILEAKLKGIPLTPGQSERLLDKDGKMCGYQYKYKNGLPNGYLSFGDYSRLLFAEFGALDVWVNTQMSRAGNTIVFAYYMVDYLFKHKKAFQRSTTVAWNQN